jgi:hypothetical protein
MLKAVLQTVTALLVSATMAIPAPLWAKDNGPEEDQASTTDGVPVILQPVQLSDGKSGYLAIVPYPEEQESAVIASLAKSNPQNLILGVSGPDDPALKTALESGHLPWINSFIVGSADQSQLLAKAPKSLGERLKAKVKAITDLCKRERTGIITSLIVSGILSSYVMVESSSVSAGVKAMGALFSWIAFQSVASGKWEAYLEKGGELMTKLMTWAIGRDVTRSELQFTETAGKFHATWLANSAVASFVFWSAGTSAGLNFDGILQGFWYGFLGSTDILDAAVGEKIKQGRLPASFFKKFVIARIIAAACFEVASYLHVDHVQFGLASITTAATLYLALSHRLDPKVVERAQAMKNRALNTRVAAQKFIYSSRLKRMIPCDTRLKKNPINVAVQERVEE